MRARLALLAVAALAGVGCGDEGVAGPQAAPGGATAWARAFGRTLALDPVSLAADHRGNVVVGGRFFATADFGGGPVTAPVNNYQGYVARYDDAGELSWLLSVGDIYDDRVDHVRCDDAGNVYVVGQFRGTIALGDITLEASWQEMATFVAKLSPDGVPIWARRLTGDQISVTAVALDGSGDMTMAGWGGVIDVGSGPLEVQGQFLARLDANGAVELAQPLAAVDSAISSINALAADPSTGGTLLLGARYSEVSSQLTALTRVSAAGVVEWTLGLQVASNYVDRLTVGEDGSIYVAGSASYPFDLGGGLTVQAPTEGAAFVLGLAADGTPRWVRTFDPILAETDYNGLIVDRGLMGITALAATPGGGGVVAVGSFHGALAFDDGNGDGVSDAPGGGDVLVSEPWSANLSDEWSYTPDDVFVIALEADGSDRWHRAFGAARAQSATAVAFSGAGQVIVAGSGQGEQSPYFDGFAVGFWR